MVNEDWFVCLFVFLLFLHWSNTSHVFSWERCRCRSVKNLSPFPHLISVFPGFKDLVISQSHISFLPLRVFSCILCDYLFDLMQHIISQSLQLWEFLQLPVGTPSCFLGWFSILNLYRLHKGTFCIYWDFQWWFFISEKCQ